VSSFASDQFEILLFSAHSSLSSLEDVPMTESARRTPFGGRLSLQKRDAAASVFDPPSVVAPSVPIPVTLQPVGSDVDMRDEEPATTFDSPIPLMAGFGNLGNTCYAASVVQALAAVPRITLPLFEECERRSDDAIFQSLRTALQCAAVFRPSHSIAALDPTESMSLLLRAVRYDYHHHPI
jgi:hypothetical protein